jgi:hypothetical protein
MFTFNRHTRLRELLSAYIDGALSQHDGLTLEAHLAACEACRAELEGLRAASAALRGLPSVAAPRSFALTADQIAGPAPARAAPSPALNTAMRLSAASLAVALAAVMIADRSDLGSGGGSVSNEAARSLEAGGSTEANMADSALSEAAEDANTDQGAAAPEATGAAGEGVGRTAAGGGDEPAATPATGLVNPVFSDSGTSPEADSTGVPEAEELPADEAEEKEVFARELSEDGGGIGTLGVVEVVLALLFGSALGAALALTAVRRVSGSGTKP